MRCVFEKIYEHSTENARNENGGKNMNLSRIAVKKVSAVILTIAMVSGLAACTGNTTTDTTTPAAATTTKATEAATTAAPAETTAATAEAAASLILWGSEDDQVMLKEMAATFVGEHPTYAVEVRVTGADKAKDAAMADLDVAADVFQIPHDQLGALAEAGAVYPNTLYADAISANDSPAAITAATYGGTIYGYPNAIETYFLYYDKSVFTEADVASLDKMLEVASAADKTVGFDMGNNYFTASFWFANGCTLFGADGTDVAGSTFSSPEGLAVAEYIATLKGAGLQNIADGDATTAFASGLAAQITGSWKAGDYKTALGDNYGVAKLPTINVGGAEKQMVSFSGVKLYVVKSSTVYPEAAMQLADFLSNEANQLKAFNDRQNLPINMVAAADPAVTADPTVAAQVAQSAFSIPMPSIPQMTNFWSDSSMAVTKEIFEGTATDFQATLDAWKTLLETDVVA